MLTLEVAQSLLTPPPAEAAEGEEVADEEEDADEEE
jgi:hypothetical protein